MGPLRHRMLKQLRLRNYASRTQQIYLDHVSRFAHHFGRSPEQLGPEEIRRYPLRLVEKGVSWSHLNQAVYAWRFLYRHTLHQPTHSLSQTAAAAAGGAEYGGGGSPAGGGT